MTVEAAGDISSDKEVIQDDLPEIVGTWVAWRFANWWNQYDALSQIEQQYQRQLENLLENNEQNMRGALILMFFVSVVLHFVCRRAAQGHRDSDTHGRCTNAFTMLLLYIILNSKLPYILHWIVHYMST